MQGNERTRVLFCESNIDGTIGGSYYSLLYLVRGLDRTRYHPMVLFYADHPLVPAFRETGAEILIWPRARTFSFGRRPGEPRRWLKLPAVGLQKGLNVVNGYVWPSISRARFLKAHGIDIVHLNNSVLYNHDWVTAAKVAGTICVTHERGIHETCPAPARYFAKHLDAIICTSRAVQASLQQCGVSATRMVTIHNGLDPADMRTVVPPTALRQSLGIGPDDPVIVMVGNIKAWKGQDVVVRALDRARHACPSSRCLFIGDTAADDREYERELRGLVRSLGLESNVIFTGFQRNVADFLQMSDVLVHASVAPEPFGRVVLEAMALRKAVIGSAAGAIPEIVVEGQTGVTVPPGDVERLADAIVEVACNRDEARRLGENGYRRLVQDFHIDRNVEQTTRLYEELLTSR